MEPVLSMDKLFVVGVGRSGTSLLQSMLASHGEIVMMPETGFIRRYLVKSVFQKKKFADIQKLKQDMFVRRWVDDGMLLQENKIGSAVTYRSIYEDIQKLYAEKRHKKIKYIADKDPKLIEVLPCLDALFRNYKVIHIIRDPRDVLLSKNKAQWSKGQSLYKKLVANNAQFRISEFFLRRHVGNTFEVKYEDLINEPEKVLKSICEFLNLDFDDNMLLFQEQAKLLVSEREMSWKKETVGPLLTNNFSKWKTDMPPEISILTASCCATAMSKGSYEEPAIRLVFGRKSLNLIIKIGVNILGFFYAWKAIYLIKGN